MITDFPEARAQIQKAIAYALAAQIKSNTPAINRASRRILHEGDSIGIIEPDGTHRIEMMKHITSEFTLTQQEAAEMHPNDFLAKIYEVGNDMASQMEASLFTKINEAVATSGNTIDSRQGFNRQALLNALDKISITFIDDDRTKPIMPTVMTSPDTVKRLVEEEERYTEEENNSFLKQRDQILDKKYSEFITDLKSRKLID